VTSALRNEGGADAITCHAVLLEPGARPLHHIALPVANRATRAGQPYQGWAVRRALEAVDREVPKWRSGFRATHLT